MRLSLLALITCLCGVQCTLHAESRQDGEVLQLEAFIVEETQGEPWQYIKTPQYEILSHCSAKFNRVYLGAVTINIRAREALLPASLWGELAVPLKIILYDEKIAAPKDIFGPDPLGLSLSTKPAAESGGKTLLISHPKMVGDGDLFVSCGNYAGIESALNEFTVNVDGDLLLAQHAPALPGWFVSGINGEFGLYNEHIIENRYSGPTLVVAPMEWTSPEATVAYKKAVTQTKKGRPLPKVALLPLASILEQPKPEEPSKLWSAECALFARWGLLETSTAPVGRKRAFVAFVEAASHQRVTERLFIQCFGFGYAEAEHQLSDYLPAAVSGTYEMSLGQAGEERGHWREANDSEVARIVGDWLWFESKALGPLRFKVKEEYADRADKLFRKRFELHETNPLFLAEFGIYAAHKGDNGNAETALEAAAASDIVRPTAYIELARLKMREAAEGRDDDSPSLNAEELAPVVALLTTAARQHPGLKKTYEVLAEALRHASPHPPLENFLLLQQALHFFPSDANLRMQISRAYEEAGYTAEFERQLESTAN